MPAHRRVTGDEGRRRLLLPGTVVLVAFLVLLGLGGWQLQRLSWKEALIAAVAERAGRPAEPPPVEADWPRLDPSALEYRHVVVSGTFRHQDEALVFTYLGEPRGPAGGPGFWVMTPLVLRDGSIIIVNRGFVPQERADPARRAEGQLAGEVEVVGLLRWSEDRNWFTPADDPSANRWFTRDPQAIGRARGLDRVAPFTVDAEATAPGGLPQGGETRLNFSNRHLEYALTWFGLAVTLLVVAAQVFFRRGRDRPPPHA
jgi:surfeit locus 1 family protein